MIIRWRVFRRKGNILNENKSSNSNSTELNALSQNKKNMPKLQSELWQNAFAVSVILLNDRDVNKTDNIGVVYKDKIATKLSLFDLGHPTPDNYELQAKTLTTEIYEYFRKSRFMGDKFICQNKWLAI